MLHRLATQQASYDVADRNAQSVLVYRRMMEDMYRRRAPAASPPLVPGLREQPGLAGTTTTPPAAPAAPVLIKLEQCDTDAAAAAAAAITPIRHEQELVDFASAGSYGCRDRSRWEIEASRVYVGRRADADSTVPTQGPRVRETGDRRHRIQPIAVVSAGRVHDEAGHRCHSRTPSCLVVPCRSLAPT